MKFKDWINYKFPLGELMQGGSSVDGSDSPVIHPIGLAPQLCRPDIFLKKVNEFPVDDLNVNLCHNGHVRDWCSYNTENRIKKLKEIQKHDFIKSYDSDYGQKRVKLDEYADSFLSHKFVCSPEGNGIDCHRHYEILLCKGIAILQVPDEEYSLKRWGKNSLMEKYSDLPVLWTKDYSDLSVKLLNSTYEKFLEKEFNFEKLKKSYWLKISKTFIFNSNHWINHCCRKK